MARGGARCLLKNPSLSSARIIQESWIIRANESLGFLILRWNWLSMNRPAEAQRKAKNFHGKISDYQLLIFVSFSRLLVEVQRKAKNFEKNTS